MIIQQYGGQQQFKIACLEAVLNKGFELANLGNLKVVQDSVRVTSDVQDLMKSFDPAKPLRFSFEFDVVPPLSWRRSYKDIQVAIR